MRFMENGCFEALKDMSPSPFDLKIMVVFDTDYGEINPGGPLNYMSTLCITKEVLSVDTTWNKFI